MSGKFPPLPSAKLLLDRLGLKATKGLGQNFLSNSYRLSACLDLLASLSPDHPRILEIGPGLGHLTELLFNRFDPVAMHVIEKDSRFITHLRGHFGDSLLVHRMDVMSGDFPVLLRDLSPDLVFGNLPYHLATALIEKILVSWRGMKVMGFMLQAEVAARYQAEPGDRNHGYTSLLAQSFCRVRELGDFGPEEFFPPPRVSSRFLSFEPIPNRTQELPEEAFLAFCRDLFAHPRKQLGALFPTRRAELARIADEVGFQVTARPGELSPRQAIALFRGFSM